jgi:hypothetical protein
MITSGSCVLGKFGGGFYGHGCDNGEGALAFVFNRAIGDVFQDFRTYRFERI